MKEEYHVRTSPSSAKTTTCDVTSKHYYNLCLRMLYVECEVADVVVRCVDVIRSWIDVLVVERHLKKNTTMI